jgi:hypothetical protein
MMLGLGIMLRARLRHSIFVAAARFAHLAALIIVPDPIVADICAAVVVNAVWRDIDLGSDDYRLRLK